MNTITTFLGRFCVLAALIAAPWANVGADAKNFRILLYLALASGILAFVSLWTTPRRDRRTNAYFGTIATAIPLALGLALAVFQFQPLSEETLARVSPRVLELKAELLPPDCVGSAHITETDRPVEPVDTAETVEATKSVDAAGTVEAIESVETAGTVGTTGTVEAVETTKAVEAFATGEAPSLDAFADPKFRAPALLDEAEETALREALSEPFPFDPETPFDLQSATAVDAAVERAFLPVDAPARNAWGRTISVYPLATRQTTLIFGTALIFFLSTAILFNSNASRRFLWSAVALNGLAVALFVSPGARIRRFLRTKRSPIG